MSYANFSKNTQVAILAEEAATTFYKSSDEAEKRTILVQRNNQTKQWISSFDKKLARMTELFPSLAGRGN